MRPLKFLLAIFFLAMAALQFNDPDPAYWIAVYGGTAAVSLAAALGFHRRFWTALTIGGVLAGLLIAAPGTLDYLSSGNPGSIFGQMMDEDYIEPAREFFGLLICLAALVLILRGK